MVLRAERDLQRFRQIVRGQIRQNLRRYMTTTELLGRRGKDFVSIPLPQIEIPTFCYGPHAVGGVGQGEGEVGTPLTPPEPSAGPGAGDLPGEHILEVEVELAELAELLGEELELPRIRPRGRTTVVAEKGRYSSIRRAGPESLRHFRRTYKRALVRQVASGMYELDNPVVVPVHEDMRYRSWKERPTPDNNAVILYMMDVSGSMGDEQKEIVRIESFWIDTWLRSQYKGLETRYIIHDAEAREVDQHTFYHTRESGGTKISSAYKLCRKLVEAHYDPSEWNIYPFHFSDGDNWDGGDNELCIRLLREELLPHVNLFCYAQVKSFYGSGQFKRDLDQAFQGEEALITSEIQDRNAIYRSIREFLGRGR
ncbi:MAG: DUF444 family protein [Nitrospinota bacterium]